MAVYRTCAADGCSVRRRADQIMCRRCWAAVPKAIQNRVYAAYDPHAGIRQSGEWAFAVADAIASLRPAGTQGLPL